MARVVRCKMKVVERKEFAYWGSSSTGVGIKLAVVSGNEDDHGQLEENRRFFEATPVGTFDFNCKPDASVGLEVGVEYYVDIVSADRSE